MANAFFASAKARILGGDDDWDSDHRVIVGDAADDDPSVVSDDFLDDIASGARVGVSGAIGSLTKTEGRAGGAQVSFSPFSGDVCEWLVLYRHTGTESSSGLVVKYDTAPGLPFTPNGGALGITWSSYLFSIAEEPAPSLLLSVSPNGRYLVDGNGDPFQLSTDAFWVGCNHLEEASGDWEDYFEYITSKGYNGTIMMLIVKATSSWPTVSEPTDADGNAPFSSSGDFETAQDAYFDRCVRYVDLALNYGVVSEIFFAYAGASADGWKGDAESDNTNQQCFDFMAYVHGKFAHLPNILWMHWGDDGGSGTRLTRYQNLAAGLQSVQRTNLNGSELASPDTLATSQSGFTYGTDPATSDIQINSWYGAGPSSNGRTYDTALRAWDNSPTLPSKMQEPVYENAWYAPSIASRAHLRKALHWSRTSGACGQTTGVHGRWQANPVGNESALSSQGGSASWRTGFNGSVDNDASLAIAFYGSLEWWRLVPSGTAAGRCGRLLIVSTNTANDGYISSAQADDGSFVVAYVPPTGTGGTTFQVDLRGIGGACTGRYWNPTTGLYTSAGTFAGTESAQSFTTPGNNGTSANDWILLLEKD